jgi:cytochrome c-type biogenesis protein CcmH/NrfG
MRSENGMEHEPTAAYPANPSLQATHVYIMAVICLGMGLGIGYLLRGTHTPVAAARTAVVSRPPSAAVIVPSGSGHTPTLDQMKQMADKQASPLLDKLKNNPNDTAVLVQVGALYHTSHQFKEAATYYAKAVQVDPKNVGLRTKLAASLYRAGDVDGATAQLDQALKYDPRDANSLFNLGMIRLQGKRDGKGALAAWQQLLKSNPQLAPERKAMVQKLMADVLTTLADQPARQGKRRQDEHEPHPN